MNTSHCNERDADDKKEIKIGNRWAKLGMLFQIGLSLLVISGLFTFLHERIHLAFTADGLSRFPSLHLSVLLLFVIMFLIVQWIRASSGEIKMLKSYFKEDIPQVPGSAFFTVISLALLLGTMGYFSPRIEIFAGILHCTTLWIYGDSGTSLQDSKL